MNGMLGLIGRDLVAGRRILLGFLAVTVAAGCIAGCAAAMAGGAAVVELSSVGAGDSAEVQSGFTDFLVGLSIAFALIPSIVVLSSTARLAVRLRRRGLARWLLIGIPAGRVRAIVRTQFVAIAVVGGAIGVGIAGVWAPTVLGAALTNVDVSVDGVPGRLGFEPALTPAGAAIALAAVVLIVLVSTSRAITEAANTSPIEAVRASDAPAARRRGRRIVLCCLLGFLALVCLSQVATRNPMVMANGAVMLPVMLAATVAATGSWLALRALRTWTALLPATRSSSWYLARHEAHRQLERSSAAVNPLMIGMALAAGAYGVVATMAGVSTAGGGTTGADVLGFVMAIGGGPLVIAAVGAAAVVAMSGNDREHQIGLLRASGATPAVLIRSAVFEAVVLSGTAALLALVIDLVAVGLVSAALGFVPVVFPPLPLLVMAVGAIMLMVIATLLPTLQALARPTTRSLVVE